MGIHVNHQSVVNGDMSAATVDAYLDIRGKSRVEFQAVWTGAPVGVFTIAISDFPNAILANNTPDPRATWTALPSPPAAWALSPATPAGAAGDYVFQMADQGGSYMRLRYTKTSGTGSLNIFASAKP